MLLIIMMVVAPMMQQNRKDIKPPTLQSGAPVEQNKLTVEIASDGQIYIQGQQANPDQLTETLKTEEAKLVSSAESATAETTPANPEQPAEKNIIIRADKATKSGQVLKIFEAARDAGFTKVTVAGEPLQEARQEELRQTSMGRQPQAQGGA